MKPSFLAVLPCDTREQAALRHIAFSGTRSVQRHLNIFHDPMLLYKNAGYLGAIEVSVFSMGTAFNLISCSTSRVRFLCNLYLGFVTFFSLGSPAPAVHFCTTTTAATRCMCATTTC